MFKRPPVDRIFLRESVVEELKEVIETKCKDKKRKIFSCLFKNSPKLRRRFRDKIKDFRFLKDIYYIFNLEMSLVFEITIQYETFRALFYKYFPEWREGEMK